MSYVLVRLFVVSFCALMRIVFGKFAIFSLAVFWVVIIFGSALYHIAFDKNILYSDINLLASVLVAVVAIWFITILSAKVKILKQDL